MAPASAPATAYRSPISTMIIEMSALLSSKATEFADYLTHLKALDITNQEHMTMINADKTNAQLAINSLSTGSEQMRQRIQQAAEESTTFNADLTAMKASVKKLTTEVEEQRALKALRQEQADALEDPLRSGSNYHSSWLGLSKPMKEESHTGLLVAAVFFGILAIVGAVYAYKAGLFARRETPDLFRAFKGGFRMPW
jgi:hypothetical protein